MGRRFRFAPVLALCAASLLAGCAGLRGVQENVTAADLKGGVCPTPDELTNFAASLNSLREGLTAEQYRDKVIGQCIRATDNKFAQFVLALRRESTGVKLGSDLAALALTGLGATGTSPTTMAAAASGIIGAGAAVNKDVYYDQTLPALISAMAINRNQILSRIRTNQQQDAQHYTLADAGHDIWDLENASNIDMAIKQLITVTQTAENATADLPPITLAIVDPAAQNSRVTLLHKIDALYAAGNRATLDEVAAALGLAPDLNKSAAHTTVVYATIKSKILTRTTTPADASALAAALSPILG